MLSCTIQLCFQGFQVFRVSGTRRVQVLVIFFIREFIINGRNILQILINEEKDESSTFQLIFLTTFVGFVLAHLYVYCYVGEMLLVQVSHAKVYYSVIQMCRFKSRLKNFKITHMLRVLVVLTKK